MQKFALPTLLMVGPVLPGDLRLHNWNLMSKYDTQVTVVQQLRAASASDSNYCVSLWAWASNRTIPSPSWASNTTAFQFTGHLAGSTGQLKYVKS